MTKAKGEKRPLSIVERRLKGGSIFGTSSKPIPLVEPDRWSLRVVNSQISNTRVYDMQAEKGWTYATVEDLAVKPEEVGLRELDGRIVRGTHAEEVLMKMERADYRAIQKVKDATNREQTFGKKAIKDTILGAVQQEPDGDRGADFLNRSINRITVKDSLERVDLSE